MTVQIPELLLCIPFLFTKQFTTCKDHFTRFFWFYHIAPHTFTSNIMSNRRRPPPPPPIRAPPPPPPPPPTLPNVKPPPPPPPPPPYPLRVSHYNSKPFQNLRSKSYSNGRSHYTREFFICTLYLSIISNLISMQFLTTNSYSLSQ